MSVSLFRLIPYPLQADFLLLLSLFLHSRYFFLGNIRKNIKIPGTPQNVSGTFRLLLFSVFSAVLCASECENRVKDDRKDNRADCEANSFSKVFAHIYRHPYGRYHGDDCRHDDKYRENKAVRVTVHEICENRHQKIRDIHCEEHPSVPHGKFKLRVSVIKRDDCFPSRFSCFYKNLPIGNNKKNHERKSHDKRQR